MYFFYHFLIFRATFKSFFLATSQMMQCGPPLDKKKARWKASYPRSRRETLTCYGHGIRANNLSTTIQQEITLVKRRNGRQENKSADNVTECTGRSFTENHILVRNRVIWKNLFKCSDAQRHYDYGRPAGRHHISFRRLKPILWTNVKSLQFEVKFI